MKTDELKRRIKRDFKRSYDPNDMLDIAGLVSDMDASLDKVEEAIRHARDMTLEAREFPSVANDICAQLAQENVIHMLTNVSQLLSESYELVLSDPAKKLFPFEVFKGLFEERLFHIDFGED